MAGWPLPQCFQQIEGADDVRFDVGARVLGAVTHARLRGEMKHHVGTGLGDKVGEQPRVLDHGFAAHKGGRARELLVRAPLEIGIVVGGQAVDTEDTVSVREQTLRQVKTDEACRSGNEEAHQLPLMKYDARRVVTLSERTLAARRSASCMPPSLAKRCCPSVS